MSDLLVLGLKLLFLALLWLFVLFAINVIRTDVFGRRVPASAVASDASNAAAVAAPPAKRRGRASKLPTTLRVTAGNQAGVTVPLGESVLIGRTHDSNLVLDDQYMSTRHALITRTGSGYVVEDLGSTNGTYLNEQRLTTPTTFSPADTLRIGRTTMTLDA